LFPVLYWVTPFFRFIGVKVNAEAWVWLLKFIVRLVKYWWVKKENWFVPEPFLPSHCVSGEMIRVKNIIMLISVNLIMSGIMVTMSV